MQNKANWTIVDSLGMWGFTVNVTGTLRNPVENFMGNHQTSSRVGRKDWRTTRH